jgi:hemoglobin
MDLYLQAVDEAALPPDEPFREAVRSHLEFGSRIAQQNPWAKTDAELDPIRTVPHWEWPDIP